MWKATYRSVATLIFSTDKFEGSCKVSFAPENSVLETSVCLIKSNVSGVEALTLQDTINTTQHSPVSGLYPPNGSSLRRNHFKIYCVLI